MSYEGEAVPCVSKDRATLGSDPAADACEHLLTGGDNPAELMRAENPAPPLQKIPACIGLVDFSLVCGLLTAVNNADAGMDVVSDVPRSGAEPSAQKPPSVARRQGPQARAAREAGEGFLRLPYLD